MTFDFSSFSRRTSARFAQQTRKDMLEKIQCIERGEAVYDFSQMIPTRIVNFYPAFKRLFEILEAGWDRTHSTFDNPAATAERIRAEVLPLITDAGEDYLTVNEVAELKHVTRAVISRILNDDQKRAATFPNAYRVEGSGRGVWQIPRAEAEAWAVNPRGWKKGEPRN